MNIFSRIRIPKLGRNNFDISFENKLTCQMGQLVPIVCQEVIPGDEFKMSSNILVRFNPLLAPMMHRVDVYTHFFFVPNRLIWNEWEDFITGGEDGLASPVKPFTTWRELLKLSFSLGPGSQYVKFAYNLIGPGSLLDYLGVGLGVPMSDLEQLKLSGNLDNLELDWLDEPIELMPLHAYLLIYNEYYRNQNTQPEIPLSLASGERLFNDNSLQNLITLRWRNWGLDYFTSALPFSQRGPEQLVPVTGLTINYNDQDGLAKTRLRRLSDGQTPDMKNLQQSSDGGLLAEEIPSGVLSSVNVDNSSALSVDENTSISIRALRRAERIQEWLETSARVGSRYIEQIKGHFGIFSSDARLQRPEYLGGGKQAVQISAVDQTSATDFNAGSTPLGTMAGKAISAGTTNGFKTKTFEEHGFIIGIMSVLPKGGYHQGLHRKFSRFDKLDYFWPEFQNIGDQEIKTKELYFAQSLTNNNVDVGFGYTPRYSEYKSNHDEVHGDFKTTLDFWHLNRKFANIPRLNSAFSTTNNNIRQDIFAVQTDADGNELPNLQVYIYNNIISRRPMYYYDDPQL